MFSLLQKCLTFNPAKRISAYGALSHPYFQDLERYKDSLHSHLSSSQSTSELNTAWGSPGMPWAGHLNMVADKTPTRALQSSWRLLAVGFPAAGFQMRSASPRKPPSLLLRNQCKSDCSFMFVYLFVCLCVSRTWKTSRRREAADRLCCHFLF